MNLATLNIIRHQANSFDHANVSTDDMPLKMWLSTQNQIGSRIVRHNVSLYQQTLLFRKNASR